MLRIEVETLAGEVSAEDCPVFVAELAVKPRKVTHKNLARCKSKQSAAMRLAKNIIEFTGQVVTELDDAKRMTLLNCLREQQGPGKWLQSRSTWNRSGDGSKTQPR